MTSVGGKTNAYKNNIKLYDIWVNLKRSADENGKHILKPLCPMTGQDFGINPSCLRIEDGKSFCTGSGKSFYDGDSHFCTSFESVKKNVELGKSDTIGFFLQKK